MYGEDSFHGVFGGGFMWFLWIILLVIIFYMLKNVVASSKATSSGEDALDILKRRYARGDIDEAEYERRKLELEK